MKGRRRSKPTPPAPRSGAGTPPPKGILELDRFSQASVEKWNEISADLDELNAVLHFSLEPERRRRRQELLAALQKVSPQAFVLQDWARIIDYQWTLYPLSAAGSLLYVGGRFNAGQDLDRNTLEPWPALYVAEDYLTAFREKFQLSAEGAIDGLTPQELALTAGKSHSTVILNGKLSRVFVMSPDSLAPVAKVLHQIKMPDRAEQLKRKLGIKSTDLRMVGSGKQLYDIAATHNWRILPVQFGLPSPSQVLAELIRSAGFEAIAYPSSKGGKHCLALFVDRMATGSYIELTGTPPAGATPRLDEETADQLAGWAQVGLTPPKGL